MSDETGSPCYSEFPIPVLPAYPHPVLLPVSFDWSDSVLRLAELFGFDVYHAVMEVCHG